jgi:hypothetical protein
MTATLHNLRDNTKIPISWLIYDMDGGNDIRKTPQFWVIVIISVYM